MEESGSQVVVLPIQFEEFVHQEEGVEDLEALEEDFDDDLIDEMSQTHLIQEPKKSLN